MSIVFNHNPERALIWQKCFAEHLPEMPFHIWPQTGPLEDVRYVAAWKLPGGLLPKLPNLEVLFSVGAGIDQLDLTTMPAHVKLVRMIEPGLVDGMIEYVLWAVLSLHREMFRYARQQRAHDWNPSYNRPAGLYRVGMMGLGELGSAVIEKLAALGYDCRGWSRRPHDVPGVKTFAGAQERDAFLAETDILICLVPLTEATRGILNADLFSRLPRGASIINVGRGGHLVQDDLLAALDSGQLSQAVLDVMTPEPLPAYHPFWSHPSIALTPHIASAAQPETAALQVIGNIRRYEVGQAMIGEVDTRLGY